MTPDFFRSRLDAMIDPCHPLAVLATQIDWAAIEREIAPLFAHSNREGTLKSVKDLFGSTEFRSGAGVSAAGRPRLNYRLMLSLLYLKYAFDLSDEALCERWSENVVWQYFSGLEYYTPQAPCDATQIGRFRRKLNEAGLEELLSSTLTASVKMEAVKVEELERVIVDSTVQEKAIAYPTDSRLLEVSRAKIALLAKRAGIKLKQTYEKEGKRLRRKAGGYAHAKQFKRLHKTLKRQRTILGRLIRDVRNEMIVGVEGVNELSIGVRSNLEGWLSRAEKIMNQRRDDKDKLYALHAPEVECIGKGKARHPYEFGVKVSIALSMDSGLVIGSRSFPGNPYDGHTLQEQLEQTQILLEGVGAKPKVVFTDLGYRGVDGELSGVPLIHRGKYKTLTDEQRKSLKRRQAIEPVIGHMKHDHRMNRCWLKGSDGDAFHAILCAIGFNIRWMLRAIVRLGIKPRRPIFFQIIFRIQKFARGRANGNLSNSGAISILQV